MGQAYGLPKKHDPDLHLPIFISVWGEIIRIDLFWNSSSGYDNPQISRLFPTGVIQIQPADEHNKADFSSGEQWGIEKGIQKTGIPKTVY